VAIGDGALRTGDTWLDDYDRAMKLHVGGRIENLSPPGHDPGPYYVVQIDEVRGSPDADGWIPVILGSPQDVLTPFVLPCIVIVEDSAEPDDGPRMVGWSRSYRVPTAAALAAGAIDVEMPDGTTVSGYSEYEWREGPEPAKITYTVWARGRTQREASRMARYLWHKFPKFFEICVTDSEGAERTYSAALEGMARTKELEDVLGRRPAASFTVTIDGELEWSPIRTDVSARDFSHAVAGKE